MNYRQLIDHSLQDPTGFWQQQAAHLAWYRPPQQILTQDHHGLYRWFSDGQLNTCYLAVDYHVAHGRADQLALVYDSPVTGITSQYTYRQLQQEVARFAGVLTGLGVQAGDRVIIYMPMIPQVVFAMLACARIGAVHSVVFGGFAANELAIRIDDATPKVLLAASAGKEIDRIIPYKPIIDAALARAAHQPTACVIYQRDLATADLQAGRDHDWEALLATAQPQECVPVAATDPLYILYTSGTTGRPKGIVRDNGGHAVALNFSMEQIYGVDPGDVFWAASDVGWVVGHSYIVYGPLLRGCTTILYEGKPVRTPDAGAFWRVIEAYGVKVFFTAPTAIRAIKKEDPLGKLVAHYDLSSLQALFLAGERTDVATYEWVHHLLQVPVIDHWWQTESGWPMLANLPGPAQRASQCRDSMCRSSTSRPLPYRPIPKEPLP